MKTLEKSLDILEAIADAPNGLNAEEVAELVGTNKTTAYKIATVFCKYGYMQRIPQTTRYKLGNKFYDIMRRMGRQTDIRQIALPEMRRLAAESGETINLLVQSGTKGLYIEVIESDKSAKLASSVGSMDPLHISAVGKVILSGLDERSVHDIIAAEGLPRTGKNTITAPSALKAELQKVRQDGFAIDDEESVVGARCVAAPIYNGAHDVIAAVSISSLTISSSIEELYRYKDMVIEAAKNISKALSFNT
ncbi:MAG: IclR family transcriptional regulator [Oscillospiraceae bacterium]|nr:IclR family transcriptional regulator [Oscillospiraceae bacterium]